MEASYNNETAPDFDLLIDQLAAATNDPERCDVEAVYNHSLCPSP